MLKTLFTSTLLLCDKSPDQSWAWESSRPKVTMLTVARILHHGYDRHVSLCRLLIRFSSIVLSRGSYKVFRERHVRVFDVHSNARTDTKAPGCPPNLLSSRRWITCIWPHHVVCIIVGEVFIVVYLIGLKSVPRICLLVRPQIYFFLGVQLVGEPIIYYLGLINLRVHS